MKENTFGQWSSAYDFALLQKFVRIETYQATKKSPDIDKRKEVKAQIWIYDFVFDAVKLNIEEWDV